MAYLFVPIPVVLDDLEGYLPNAGLIKCISTNICATSARFQLSRRIASHPAHEKSALKGAWSGSGTRFRILHPM